MRFDASHFFIETMGSDGKAYYSIPINFAVFDRSIFFFDNVREQLLEDIMDLKIED